MIEKIRNFIGKIYKGRGEYANATFFDIDEVMQSKFLNSLILWLIFIFLSVVIAILTLNPYIVLFGLLIGVSGVMLTSVKIDNYLNGKVFKIVGDYYDSNLPTAKNIITKKLEKEKDFITDKAFYVRISRKEDGSIFQIPVPRSFNAKKGNEITAYITESRGFYDDDDTYIVRDCYYAYVSKQKK